MYEVKEVHHYDDTASTGNSMVAIFAIVLLAIVGIGLLVWQPWAATSTNSTTIVHDNPGSSSPTIINPPANNTTINPPAQTAPAPTNVNVTVPPANNSGGNTSNGDNGANGTSNDGGTTGQ